MDKEVDHQHQAVSPRSFSVALAANLSEEV